MVGDVDQGAGFVGADLVEEDGGTGAEDDMAVAGCGEGGVYKLEAIEFRSRSRSVGVMVFAKLGSVAVGYYSEGAEIL